MKLFSRAIESNLDCEEMSQFDRNIRLIGAEKQNQLRNARVLFVGIGGVGGFALELLARAGVGRIGIVDGDKVDITNLNRQILATHSTIGHSKVDVAERRIADINPTAEVTKYYGRYNAASSDEILGGGNCSNSSSDCVWDYCIDAIDSVSDKVHLIVSCQNKSIPIISAMGAGNRLEFDYKICDIFQTKYDGLARVVRKKLKECGISGHTVACSNLDSSVPSCDRITGSFSPSPSMLGNVIASFVLGELLNDRNS